AEEEAPELARRRRGGRDRVGHTHLAACDSLLPVLLDPVRREAFDGAVELERRVELRPGAVAPVLRIGQAILAPELTTARDHPGPAVARLDADPSDARGRQLAARTRQVERVRGGGGDRTAVVVRSEEPLERKQLLLALEVLLLLLVAERSRACLHRRAQLVL